MKEHQGIYLPDGEIHLIDWMTKSGEIVDDKGTYQIKKLRNAIAYCRNFRTAVDIGAHVGLWSMQLDKIFYTVHSFEPVAAHRECFLKNLKAVEIPIGEEDGYIAYDSEWTRLHPCALGAKQSMVKMISAPTSSGDTKIDAGAEDGDTPMETLDSFALEDVDFIKLDCEGYEYFALKGGEKTIHDQRPVIIVEQKPGRAQRFGLPEQGAVDYLREHFGYRLAEVMSGDFIMTPG